MITEKVSTLKINKLSRAQYEREYLAGRLENTALYLTPDDTPNIVQMTKEEYEAAVLAGTLDEDTIYLIPDVDWTKTVNNSTRITVTVEDLTEYYFPNATYVEINLPTDVTHYESWLFIGGANATISVNGGTCLGITEYTGSYSTSCAEVSIKDGRYLIATDYIS